MQCPKCKGDFLQPVFARYFSDIEHTDIINVECPYCDYVFREVKTK